MTYSLGTGHSLSGTGSVAIAGPIGLKIALATLPAFVSRRDGTPLEYSSLGWLAVGTADGYLPRIVLHHADQLAYPLADGMTLLGYSLKSGTTATVTELLAVPPPSNQLAPWDRNPVIWAQANSVAAAGGSGAITLWTYTVPAGKILLIQTAKILLKRLTAATTANFVTVSMSIDTAQVLLISDSLEAALTTQTQQLQAFAYAFAGQVVKGAYNDADTGGTASVSATAAGFLFDA